ncbi:MAG: hypothetical protein FWE36_00065 [Erysipelotrichales bacterium]|nr:hypothetical protein [Erysipelotrichales bacterium]
MDNNFKETNKNNSDNHFVYLNLLDDNAPRAFPEYDGEAMILKKKIDNQNVFNIAVVAKYGAGKSSVINTYLYNHRRTEQERLDDRNMGKPENNKYARITLSTFNNADYDEAAIERSILQQLLYSRNKSELPNSEIKRTNQTCIKKSIGKSILLTVFIITALLFIIEISGFLLFGVEWIKFLFLTISSGLLGLIVFYIIYYRKFSKIKYKDFEVDLKEDESGEKSAKTINLINKFIDEVLYFFECINVNLIIFEDLDRLPTTEIFAKLRELNTIINSSRKCKEKVTFLYAVKDELFKTEDERAKFFEFILPVIPIVNPVTAEETLRNKLKELLDINEKMKLNDKFIKKISPYILDMRIMKNTFNDFIIMFNKIFDDKNARDDLKSEMLFALCLYKNLFPYDYSLLGSDKGLIPNIIDVTNLRNKASKNLRENILLLKQHIENLKSERIESFDELLYMFVGQLMEFDYGGYQQSGLVNPFDIKTFDKLNIKQISHPQSDNHMIRESKELIELLDNYKKREKLIKEKRDYGIVKINEEITRLDKERHKILSLNFLEIVEKFDVNFCFQENLKEEYLKEINKSLPTDDELFLESFMSANKGISKTQIEELETLYKKFKQVDFSEKLIESQINYIRFLIANGYIDEHYLEYTSNYRAQLITPKDLAFIMSVQRRVGDYDCIHDNLMEVIGRLEEIDFKHTSILNKNILDNVKTLKNISIQENSRKFDNLLGLLQNTEDKESFDTLTGYFNTSETEQIETLLKNLIPLRPILFVEMLDALKLTEEKRNLVFVCTVKYVSSYKAANLDNKLSLFISEHDNYMELFNDVGDNKKIISFISNVKPQFKKLSKEILNKEVQEYIILNSYYELTLENLETIFCIEDTNNLSDDFYTKNYTFISSSSKDSVLKYINSNLNDYAFKILLNEKVSGEKESEDKVKYLIESKDIALDIKELLMKKIDIKFEKISEFNEDLFELLLENNLIEPRWSNIIYAFEKKGFQCIKSFLIKNTRIDENFIEGNGLDIHTRFLNDLVRNVASVEIKNIVNTMSFTCGIGLLLDDEGDVSDDVLAEFVMSDKIKFIEGDLKRLYSKPKTLNEYLKKHESLILQKFDVFFDCVLPIVNTTNKQTYQNGRYVNVPITTYKSKENANKIIAAVMDCKIINLEIKRNLVDRCQEIIDIDGFEKVFAEYVLNERIAVPPKILWQFKDASISKNDKLMILSHCDFGTKETDSQKIKDYLIALGTPYTLLFGEAKEAKIDKNDSTEKMLIILKQKGLVSSWKKVALQEEYKVKAF